MVTHVSCREAGYDCDFEIYDENEDELVAFVQQHAKETHGTDVPRETVLELATEA